MRYWASCVRPISGNEIGTEAREGVEGRMEGFESHVATSIPEAYNWEYSFASASSLKTSFVTVEMKDERKGL
jgi:hypothetical protein